VERKKGKIVKNMDAQGIVSSSLPRCAEKTCACCLGGDNGGSNHTEIIHEYFTRQIAKLKSCEIISEKEVKDLCNKAREILVEESNVQRISSPVTVRCL